MNTLNKQISALLLDHKNNSRLRQLKTSRIVSSAQIIINGDTLTNFASNDYLGLSQHQLLKERAIEAINKYGVGSPSSRLIAGNCELYDEVESRIAELKGTETALVFPTGFQTNLSIMLALAKLNTLMLCDELSHNSILLAAPLNKRNFLRFEHNNVADLKRLTENKITDGKIVWAVTESVFSMGDIAPVESLVSLSQTRNIHLYIDEAHATGVFGENGMGFIHAPDSKNVVMGTFGKGCGSFGAYIACSFEFKDFLVNFCPGIIYTTALPPSVLGSIAAALELIPQMISQRQRLLELANHIRQELTAMGLRTGKDASQIIYLYTNSDEKAVALSRYLYENQIYAPAIRPPTVPENDAGIRLSLSAIHEDAAVDHLIQTLKRWQNNR